MSPDGVIQNPQDWPGNSIEPDLHLGVFNDAGPARAGTRET